MIKNNRIAIASVIASSIMIIGCSNKNIDNKSESSRNESLVSKEATQVDLLKTGIKFREVSYMSEDYSFSVDVSEDLELKEQELRIRIDNLNIDNEAFCEEVKVAVKSLGGTDADYEKIMEILKGYIKESEIAENKNDFHLYEELKLNENTVVGLSLLMYEDTKDISVRFIADDCTKYIESTNLKFNTTIYENEDTKVEVEQSLLEDGSFTISVNAPLSKKDDIEFKEHLDAAFKYFSVSDEDIKKVNDTIASGNLDLEDPIVVNDSYIISTYLYEEDDEFSIEITRF